MIVRPIAHKDIDALYDLAIAAGVGMNSLPADRDFLAQKIDRAVQSFQQKIPQHQASYIFVLADDQDRALGVCGIEASIGWDEPWYTYRVSQMVHACRDIDIYTNTPTLFLTNDQIGYSELCSLLVHPDARANKNGPLLSRCRFLFIRQFRELFGQKLFAEMRGFNDEQGHSPFWDDLGKKFFNMEFERIDFLTGRGQRSIIAELMPKYPVYSHLLSESARNCIGKVHPNTQPALEMLKQEGLRYENYVAIFDGGPVVEAYVDDLRLIKQAKNLTAVAKEAENLPSEQPPLLLCNQARENFRCKLTFNYQIEDNQIHLPSDVIEQLKLEQQTVTVASLYAKDADVLT
ncbi:arginine N-succinyltransferase [Litoribrevibacter albus]|uniref:Arginine N-succinyltransferase n=1 Tax=Litoribrevibacter albus TaxID=1473156 RepID=A0AA37SD96_9GAMM|nr:arginine N-succinyltransferase [Litoribrevibacter albus]GLQ32918.1 arginine N-succinyltransferase [Litoribrevibacter albus]